MREQGPDGAVNTVTRTMFTTRDPDHAHEYLAAIYAHHTAQVSGGRDRFLFAHSMMGAKGFALARVRHSRRVQIDAEPLHDVLSVTTFHGGPGEISCGGDTVRPGRDEPVLTPTGPMRTWWDDLDNTTVVLDAGAVGDFGEAVSGVRPTFDGMRPLSPGLARYWQATGAHLRDDVLADPAAAGPLVLAAAFHRLAAALLTVFPNTAMVGDHHTVSERAVRRAVDHIDAHVDDPIGPADLAAAARAPYRDLAEAFRRRRGRSPGQELWRARLARAHRDLQAVDPARGDTVAAIAARWGFPDPARFAVAYRAVYGCPPQETLHG